MKLPVDIDRAILPALREFPHQRYDQAPYGALWYLVSIPLGYHGDAVTYVMLSATFNLFISTLVIILTLPFGILFVSISIFHAWKAPWNLPILWLTLLGFISPWLLVLPILAKFPVGNFQAQWWQTRQALTWQKNPYYYGSIALVWVAVLFLSLRL